MHGPHLHTGTWLAFIFNDVITLICVMNPLSTGYCFWFGFFWSVSYCVHLALVKLQKFKLCSSLFSYLWSFIYRCFWALVPCLWFLVVSRFSFRALWAFTFCLWPHDITVKFSSKIFQWEFFFFFTFLQKCYTKKKKTFYNTKRDSV